MSMRVCISEHAINRCRERLFDYTSCRKAIIDRLKEVAIEGRQVRMRPGSFGNCIELYSKGIFIVVMKNNDKLTVITCLGDSSYRKWVKNQDIYMKVSGRVLFQDQYNKLITR